MVNSIFAELNGSHLLRQSACSFLHVRSRPNGALVTCGEGCNPNTPSGTPRSENDLSIPAFGNLSLMLGFLQRKRESRMILRTPWKIMLGVVAAAMVIFNVLEMAPAFAAPQPLCQHIHASSSADEDHHIRPVGGCCSGMHCCPMLPSLPTPAQPVSSRYQHRSLVKADEPLLLIRPIDPPPRTLES
jgi:hypothetical protein